MSVDNMKHSFEACTNMYTHVNYSQNPGRMKLKDDRVLKFWTDYCTALEQSKTNKSVKLYIGERVKFQSPIVVNINLSFNEELEHFDEELWSFLVEIVYEYQIALFELLKQPEDGTNILFSCLLAPQKLIMNKESQITYTYRLQFPYCRVDLQYHQNVILPKVIQSCRSDNLFTKINGQQPLYDWKDILTIPKETVPLYGSIESLKYSPLYLRAIFNDITNIDIDTDALNDKLITNVEDIFDPSIHDHVAKGMIDLNEVNFSEPNRWFWLPMFFSMSYWNKVVLPKESGRQVSLTPSLDMTMQSTEEQGIVESLIPFLSKKRFSTESVWMDIGQALHYVYKGGSRGKSTWQEITEKYTTFKASECEAKYDRFNNFPMITHRTIAWYVYMDNPEAYEQWHQRWIQPALDDLFRDPNNITHADVAKVVYRKYWLDYVYENENWYEFNNHGWTFQGKKPVCIRKKIVFDFIPYLMKLSGQYRLKQSEQTDENERNSFEPKIDCLNSVIKKMKVKSFISQMVDYSDVYFEIPNFSAQLDRNPKLMRLLNGVIECTDTQAIFRAGKPEDYLSHQAGVKYNVNLKWTDKIVQNFEKWMKQIFIDKDVIRYVLKLFSSFLHGGNINKEFIVFSGEFGNNCKTTIVTCLRKAFGNYHVEIPTSALTGKRGQSENATPALARLANARIASAKESDEGDKMQVGVIKELTGNENIFARKLHDNGGDIEPQVKLIFQCNTLNEFNHPDQAMKNRLINIPFNSIWTKNAPDTEEEQFKLRKFPLDPYFKDRIPEYAEAMMWVLVQYYKHYCSEKLDIPLEIKRNTENYWREHDLHQQFIDSELIQVKDEERKANVFVTMKDAWNMYTNWMQEMHPQHKVGDSTKFYKEMDKRLGLRKDRRWYGYMINEQEVYKNS